MLAKKSEQSATHYAVRLLRLSGALPSDIDKLGDRFSRWLLVSCGKRWAMSWLDGREKSDIHLYAFLLSSYHES